MTETAGSEAPRPTPSFALFGYGFRPFFWAAGAYALIAIAAWLAVFVTGAMPLPGLLPQLWHGHEMIYGFAAAAIAGFLLTAVPSWTGARGFAGAPLIAAAALWLAGRLAFAAAASLPFAVIAAAELVFVPALVLLLAPPLLRARNRNTPLLLVLLAFWATDVAFIRALAQQDAVLARTALFAAINLLLLLVTVIGGRIVPAFTANALRGRGLAPDLKSRRWIEVTVIAAMVAVVAIDVAAPFRELAGAIAAVAAIAHAWRLAGWRSVRTLHEPLLWSLHLAYAWLPIGFTLKAVQLLTGAAWAAHWLHALTVGVASAMILAVMTRASLGHTGRPLAAARPVAVAYGLLWLATLVRIAAPAITPGGYVWTVIAAGSLWIGAFALYLVVYTPILTRPRVDGRAG